MTWDSTRQHAVLFGGTTAAGTRADTTIWDGSGWTKLAPPVSPPERAGHSMAYDAARDQVLVFGGLAGALLDDTWAWDGATWTDVTPAVSPPVRLHHEMTYDAARDQVVLFGGGFSDPPYLRGDTWLWDGTSWTEATPAASPPPNKGQAMTYDPVRAEIVLFGGSNPISNDTWIWDGTTWTQRAPAATPPQRYYSSMVFDDALGLTILFGGGDYGANSGGFSDLWTWDGTNWVEIVAAGSAPPRSRFAMVYDAARDQVVVFGGQARGIELVDTLILAP